MESDPSFIVDAGFILGMIGNYLILGILIQRAVGKKRCGGVLCTYQAPHPGIGGYHSTISRWRRFVITVGWLPWFTIRIVRAALLFVWWMITRFHPRRIWLGLCVIGRGLRWTTQGT